MLMMTNDELLDEVIQGMPGFISFEEIERIPGKANAIPRICKYQIMKQELERWESLDVGWVKTPHNYKIINTNNPEEIIKSIQEKEPTNIMQVGPKRISNKEIID